MLIEFMYVYVCMCLCMYVCIHACMYFFPVTSWPTIMYNQRHVVMNDNCCQSSCNDSTSRATTPVLNPSNSGRMRTAFGLISTPVRSSTNNADSVDAVMSFATPTHEQLIPQQVHLGLGSSQRRTSSIIVLAAVQWISRHMFRVIWMYNDMYPC